MKLTRTEYIDILEHYGVNFSKSLPIKYLRKMVEELIAQKMCRCIKKVKNKYEDYNESRAIGICNYSIVNWKKLKINGFTCKKKAQLKALKDNPNANKLYKDESKIRLNNKTKKNKQKK